MHFVELVLNLYQGHLDETEIEGLVKWFYGKIHFDEIELEEDKVENHVKNLLASMDLAIPGKIDATEFQHWFQSMHDFYGRFWDVESRKAMRISACKIFDAFDVTGTGTLDEIE